MLVSFRDKHEDRLGAVEFRSKKNKKPAVNSRWLANSRMLDLLAAQGLAG
jgi:hypothetical protein